jgi:hypothetical protein
LGEVRDRGNAKFDDSDESAFVVRREDDLDFTSEEYDHDPDVCPETAGGDSQGAAVLHRVPCVQHEIQQDLLELSGTALHPGKIIVEGQRDLDRCLI